MDVITKNQHTKADRLIAEGHVYRMGRGETFRVKGDSAVYTVVLLETGRFHCSCKWHTERKTACSHILAAMVLREREG